MGIKSTFNLKNVFSEFEEDKKALIDKAISLYMRLGVTAVDIAIADGNYINRKGILRSSIGCGVSFEGIIKKIYGFKTIKDGYEGSSFGKLFLEEKLKENPQKNQIRLVIVAGAAYASFVEENPQFIVIDNSVDFVQSNISSILNQLGIS